MPYFAAALTHSRSGWDATELDLGEVEDFIELADLLRELDDKADTALLFVEEDDIYVAIVRVDGADDPRVFVSDVRAGEESRIAALLLDEIGTPAPAPLLVEDELVELVDDDAAEEAVEDDDNAASTDVVPAGDSDVMADLGTPAAALLALCAHEGMLPADVITSVCEKAGCVDELEEVRGG